MGLNKTILAGIISSMGGPPQPLRFVSPANQYPNINSSYTTTNGMGFSVRQPHWIGSGDCSELRAQLQNICVSTGTMDSPGNAHTITDLFLESENLAVSVRVVFGGSNSVTLANGAYDIQSDPIYPSVFGLTKFSKGEKYYWRIAGTMPQGGKLPGVRTPQTKQQDTSAGDGATFHCNNIGGTGAMSNTSSTIFVTTKYVIGMLGKFVSGDPLTCIGCGDSIFMGTADSLVTNEVGQGYFGRAVFGNNTGDQIGGMNFGMTGAYIQLWQTTPASLMAHVKYGSSVVEEMGTNNFDGTANMNYSNMDYTMGLFTAAWAGMRANRLDHPARAFKIIRPLLLCRTTSNASGDNTPATQTIFGPKWDIGGNVDDFHTRLQTTYLGSPTGVDVIFDPSSIVRYDPSSAANTNYHKWILGKSSSGDGTHPEKATYIALGAGLKSLLDTL